MAQWQPTIGKWYDEENYVIREAPWKQMWYRAAEYEDAKELQALLIWLNQNNMHGDLYKEYVIGCFLCRHGMDGEEFPGVYDRLAAEIRSIAAKGRDLNECTALVLEKLGVSEAKIEEFLQR